MNKTLIDNSENLKMVDKLGECIDDANINTIRIATGYWDIPGMALIADKLKNFLSRDNAKLKIIIGKDPYVYTNVLKAPEFKDKSYPKDYIRADFDKIGNNLKDEYREAFQLLLDFCKDNEDESKIQIRIFKTNENDESQFFHSKCYIFTSDDDDEKDMYAILGSSNFTKKGLEGNSELNVLETDVPFINYHSNKGSNSTRKGHIAWFDDKWNHSVKWNQEFLEQVLKQSKPVKQIEKEKENSESVPFTPYELYIKLLQLKFGDVIDKNLGEQIQSYLPPTIKPFDFQIEAVKRCLRIMHEHGGFMLADVVGLGKTIVGTLIIKRFLSMPDEGGRAHKVLVVTPPAILSGWKETIKQFDENAKENNKISSFIDFVTTGRVTYFSDDISEIDEDNDDDEDNEDDRQDFNSDFNSDNYGLIIIDESHRFRNSNTKMYKALDKLISDVWNKTGAYPYVGLLSATPQNNRPRDIQNQIYLFERNRKDSTLKKAEGGDLVKFFSEVNSQYDELIKKDDDSAPKMTSEERKQGLIAISNRIRDCILTDIVERRTRTDIREHYEDDMKANHINFPEIDGPHELKYKMSPKLAQLFYDTMKIIDPDGDEKKQGHDWLGFYRYRAIEHFKDAANKKKYKGRGDRDVEKIGDQLATIMQNLLVKRLESSFTAFKSSLLNLKRYTDNMIEMWQRDTIYVCPQIDINKELDRKAKSEKRHKTITVEDCFKDIDEKINKLDTLGKNDNKQNAIYHRSDFDDNYLNLLEHDRTLISDLCDRWNLNSEDPKFDEFKYMLRAELFRPQNNESQKLVIFSEAKDTVDSLKQAVEAIGHKPLVITAANRDQKETEIKENFDANYPKDKQKNDYDVIITTEVLAEGINLHRANVILNYDTPWNSTRLMQRIGRVNRIGSPYTKVHVYNFLPSAQGNKEIDLVNKAYVKLQSFHVLFGEDNKVYIDKENVVHYDLKRMTDGDESPLEKYISELKQYHDAHAERFALIEKTEKGWEIARNTKGTAYFVVSASKSSPLAISLSTDDGNARIVSSLDLLEQLKCNENDLQQPLPSNWGKLKDSAKLKYNQYFVKINKVKAGDKATKANAVISKLYNSWQWTKEQREELNTARSLIDGGNIDLINKMIAIGNIVNDDTQLFKYTPQEFVNVVDGELSAVIKNIEAHQGEAEIKLGTIK